MPKFSQIASEYVRFLLEILNDSNHDYVLHELCQFAEYGSEGSILLLQTCLDYMNFYGRSMQDMQLKPEILSAVFRYLLSRPNFSTVFCESLRNSVIYEGFLQDFTNALHLSVAEKIGVGLALTDSENLEIKTSGQKFCMVQIEELYSNPSSVDSFEQIQNIIMFLHQSEDLDKHVDSFMQMVSLLHLKERSTSTLTPWLSDGLHEASALRNLDLFYESSENDFDAVLAEVERERSMADTVKELGYRCTVSVLHCTEVLSLFLPLTERTLSRIMSTIARIHTGLDDSQSTYITFCSALCSSAPSDLSCLSYWNVDVLVDSINQLAPGISWIHVMENLDHEGFYFPNEDAFSLFMSIYSHACQDPFPLHAICGYVWNNAEGQLSFLRYAVAAPREIFTFRHAARQLAYVDAVHGHKLHQDHAFHAWLCLDLLDVLCQLAERGHAGSVRSLLEDPLNHCPEVLLVGMAHISTAFNLIQHEVSYTVFRMLVGDATKNGVILQLWNVNPKIVLRGFVDIHNSDSNIITRILGVCQALQILLLVLEMAPFRFSIRLAALASWKELINLEEWLNDNLMTYEDVFFEECLNFLKEMPLDPAQDVSDNPFQHSVGLLNVYLATSSAILKTLQSYTGKLTSCHLSEEIKKLHIASIHAHSKLQNFETTDSSTSEGCANDIEAEATSYVDQIFLGQVTIDTMVQMLARFKDSSEKREKSIFNFIIANLFEASKFFPKYPEKQLKIAAVLFGSLIKQRLLTHPLLGVALRAVLDALRKSTDSKMFVFGATALEQFVDRLVEWPQCCNHILQISHLRSTHPELITIVERARARTSSGHTESSGVNSGSTDQYHSSAQDTLENVEVSESMWHSMAANGAQPYQQLSSPLQLQQRHQGFLDDRHRASAALVSCTKPPAGQPSLVSMNDAAGSQKSLQTVLSQNVASATTAVSSSPGFRSSRVTSSMLKQNSYSTGFGSALNIETLVAASEKRDTSIEAPASDIQDKILFMINNISSANIEVKAKEFIEILKEQYYPWFAQYMVMKRASIEPNFHDLYLKFMEKVNSKALNKEVVKATYENCKVLLSSDLIKSSSEERSLLKNLGSWLGKFTIGRNQVLRAKEIDPKALIVEAYEKGLMIAVIPFTSKILEPCQSSLAYRPPNPWTMAILSLLTEIYSLPNLKMNLKFDIEVLFKNLGVDMKDVEPSSLLKDRVREVEGNPDFSSKDVLLSQPQIAVDVSSGIISTLNQAELQSESVNSSHLGGHSNVLCQYTAPLHLASGQLMDDEKMTLLSLSDRHPSSQVLSQVSPSQTPFSVSQLPTPIHSLSSHFIVNQKLNALGLHLHFQRVVPLAMERAIKEIMSPIVHRSISIAIQTTRELVIKDYAMESDETRIHNVAHLMVESLAGSLAHVTCKEPLRSAISSQLRNSLQGLNISSELLEKAVQLVNNDNLDMGCMVIEKAAMAKATEAVDGEISQQLSLRRKHREVVGASYFDASNYTQGPMGVLPEALRPKPGHLSVSQQSVYEDFSRFPWENKSTETSNALSAVPPASSGASVSSGLPCTYGVTSGQLNSGLCSSMQVVQGFSVSKEPLDLISEDTDLSSAQLLSASCSRTGTITHIGEADGITQHGSEMNPLIASLPSTAAASEFYSVGPSSAAKVSRAATPPLPASSNMECPGSGMSEPLLTTGDALDKYQIIAHKLETLAAKDSRETEIQGVVAEVPEIILRCISRDEAALAVAQKVFKGLYENASNSLLVGAHLAILAAIRDVCKLVVKELTSWVIYSDEERKFNKDITVGLIRSELLNLAEYNLQMAKLIDAGRNKAATEFAISLLQTLVAQESGASVSELHNVVDALAKLAMRPGSPESLQQLVEIARNPSAGAASLSGFTVCKEDKARQSRDKKVPGGSLVGKEDYNNVEAMGADHAAFHEQVSGLFGEWFQICKLAGNDTACTHYISRLQQNGLLRGDDMSDRFFRLLMEIAVGHCRSFEMLSPGSLQSTQPSQNLPFLPIDAYAKLVFLILNYCAVDQGSNKVFLLPKILSVTVRVIQKDAEEKKASFNPRPYFRLLINWFLDIISPDPTLDGSSFQVLTSFANVFHALQPLKVPAFSFAWLELVSHRTFMPKLLTSNSQKGWPFVQRLLVDLFKFMEPYLRNAELGELVHFLYKGTLRVLLVLLHDFPEFLCDYHFSFCDVIPPSCIQMRNVILSAFPRNMRLPDPSTPNLKIDMLPEIGQPPRILFEVDAALKAKQMKADIDEYLRTRQQESSFLTELKQKLMLPQSEAAQSGTRYNVPLINSLVLYVGMQAIHQLHAYPAHKQSAAQTPMEGTLVSASMDIFQTLMADLDTEGRYLFLNAIANQLRYPNSHTHFFSFVLLYLFADANQEIIQEQITRVLLERLIVNRPHPWGLLITFIELIKNPRYNFWNRAFTRCAPEIEKLFESVSRSCGGPKPVDESMMPGIPDNTLNLPGSNFRKS